MPLPADPQGQLLSSGRSWSRSADQPISRLIAPTTVSAITGVAATGVAATVVAASAPAGTCRACIAQLSQGEVRYRIEWPGLSADEKAEGFVLPCVAMASSDLVLQAPGARHLGET